MHNVFQRKNENADWDVLSALPKIYGATHIVIVYMTQNANSTFYICVVSNTQRT